ncbi:MAG: tRNA preQ1(34) S-adenosylmethionine ribosyltransferase-isomerase QueA [Beijerinckiaceae bacterium]
MRVALFDFELPDDLIALRPAAPRDAARMLVVDPHAQPRLQDRLVRDLPGFLEEGDVLVVNDTRVVRARLEGRRRRGEAVAKIEVMLHKRLSDAAWRAFVRPAKKLKEGETISFDTGELEAQVIEKATDGDVLLAFTRGGGELDATIARLGQTPLPPYIAGKRAADWRDAEDYQTLFATKLGAVAAPTASLHFTPQLVAAVAARGVAIHSVTLHVGAGTFLPVKADDTQDHRIHAEWGEIDSATAEALNAARARGRRIIAAGTTSLRLLESAADETRRIHAFRGETAIFITPGYRFKSVDLLLTNFHLPRSTLFMLVCAYSGLDTMQDAYRHAIENHYRFYSYGDACLLYPAPHG